MSAKLPKERPVCYTNFGSPVASDDSTNFCVKAADREIGILFECNKGCDFPSQNVLGQTVLSGPQYTIDKRNQGLCRNNLKGHQCFEAWDRGVPIQVPVTRQSGTCSYAPAPVPCPSYVRGNGVCWQRQSFGNEPAHIEVRNKLFDIFLQCTGRKEDYPGGYLIDTLLPCSQISSAAQQLWVKAAGEWVKGITGVEGISHPTERFVMVGSGTFVNSTHVLGKGSRTHIALEQLSVGDECTITHEIGHGLLDLSGPYVRKFNETVNGTTITRSKFCGSAVVQLLGTCAELEGAHWARNQVDATGQLINVQLMNPIWGNKTDIEPISRAGLRDVGFIVPDHLIFNTGKQYQPTALLSAPEETFGQSFEGYSW